MMFLPLSCKRTRSSSGSSMDHHDTADSFSDDDDHQSAWSMDDDDLPSLKELTDGFSDERILSIGAYGKVYMGEPEYGEKIAVKMFHDHTRTHADGGHEQFHKGFCSLKRLRHQNIVRLLGYSHETRQKHMEYDGRKIFSKKTCRALCSEYMHNGDLDKYLLSDKYKGDTWQTCYKIIKGISKGLKYLHEDLESPIYHLDLKPSNVLLDETFVPKLADYGLSRLSGDDQTQIMKCFMGTIGYVPPEYIDENVISNKFDIFSLGAIIIKIMAGRMSYSKRAEMSTQQFVELVHANWRDKLHATSKYAMGSYSEQVRSCIEIALSCVEADQCKRPSIGDIVNKLSKMEAEIHKMSQYPRTSMDQMPPCLLDGSKKRGEGFLYVHTLQLQFPFEPNKLIPCQLNLTNNSDEDVNFRFAPRKPKSFLNGLSRLHGSVPPNSSCIYIVTMEKHQQPPASMDTLDVILESWVGYRSTYAWDMDDFFSTGSEEDQPDCLVHMITLTAVCDPGG
uniref:Uncharacterized protein n=1 Tax=Hordeum vulgare subsp. vulgare TaxID=112509 RepID=A0A287EKE9_HORVV